MPNNIPHDPIDEDEQAGRGSDRKSLTQTIIDGISKVPKKKFKETAFGRTLTGKNKFGKIGGTVLNIAESFLPKYVSQTRNLLQKTTNTMDKPKLKSKSIQGIIGLLITVVLQALGVDVTGDPELMNNIYHILYGLSGFWSVFGLRDALGKIITKQNETPS